MPKKKAKGKESTKFGKLYGGAVGAGYSNEEAAAMAYKKTHGMESREQKFRRGVNGMTGLGGGKFN